jgi:hypothetical protein
MIRRTWTAALGVLLFAAPISAQESAAWSALERLSITARLGQFHLAGASEFFDLIDRDLAPGASALDHSLAGGELRLRLTSRWSLVLGADAGSRTVTSASATRPTLQQQTALETNSMPLVGAEYVAYDRRWFRVVAGAGFGMVNYRLRQSGEFLDVDRDVPFAGEFRSRGHGTAGYASLALVVPVRSGVALQAEYRRQVASAPMSADYSEFDRIDLGGSKLSAGVLIAPAAFFRAPTRR